MNSTEWTIVITSFILSIVAISLIAAQPKNIDFEQCTIVNSGSGNTISQKSCTQLCGENKCILGLQRFSENTLVSNNQRELNSQENLISCNETVVYGTISDQNEIETYSFDCVCCN